ncbi:MAG: 4-hydroxythreonine-4-phosphate dehydrogenase PdxA [Acidobacteria bacterium]|nr:4-hydroxythreonine-4-phosphate dehydrogenase PdxA [Acidobacteriota bacterium]
MAGSDGNSEAKRRPLIGITIGDPAGIGPEVSLKAVGDDDLLSICTPVLIGDAQYLADWARIFDLCREFIIVNPGEHIPRDASFPVIYNLKNINGPVEMGMEQSACGRAAADYIESAVALCLSHRIDAMATAPINKKSLSLAGCNFPGHTEYLAHLSDTTDFAMAFISPRLRVALLTTHIPLARVPDYVRKSDLIRLIRLVDRELKKYGFDRPRIALAALNPHGGEGSLFGTEEATEMQPAVELCRLHDDIEVSGPHSGDTVFVRAVRGEFDIVISCYHDQGLIPIKCVSFGEAVNFTLGLPFIRTSVDHGTAFDIAGKGIADQSSMIAAIKLAADLHLRVSGLTQNPGSAGFQPAFYS